MQMEALAAMRLFLVVVAGVAPADHWVRVARGQMEIHMAVAAEVATAAVQQELLPVVMRGPVPTAAIIKGGQDMVWEILRAAGQQPARTVVGAVGVGVLKFRSSHDSGCRRRYRY